MYEMAKEGARSETKVAAAEKARMASGAVAEVEAYAKDTQIYSWFDGEVSRYFYKAVSLHRRASQSSPSSTLKMPGQH